MGEKLLVRRSRAFTLLEVLIAIMIFFMVSFAILEMVMQGLRAARAFQIRHAEAGMLAAELSLTNSLMEGVETGDFGELYPNYRWERVVTLAPGASNDLYKVDFIVYRNDAKGEMPSTLSILMYRPGSVAGAGGLGVRGRGQ